LFFFLKYQVKNEPYITDKVMTVRNVIVGISLIYKSKFICLQPTEFLLYRQAKRKKRKGK